MYQVLFVAAAFVTSFSASGIARGQEGHYVPSQYPTIQAAIDACVDGDYVLVSPGNYSENINTLGKNITIEGIGSVRPVLRGVIANQPVVTISSSTDVEIGFMTIQDGNGLIGGGAVVGSGATVRFSLVNFESNQAVGGGALAIGVNATVRLEYSEVIGNTAVMDGGGILMLDGSYLFTDFTEFENNSAGNDGGAAHLVGAWMQSGPFCGFASNTAERDGGAILAKSGSLVQFDRSDFEQNIAGRDGGAISSDASEINWIGSDFVENSAGGYGGAVVGRAGSLIDARGGVLLECDAIFGGGAAIIDSVLNASGVGFRRNQAGVGGAVLAWAIDGPVLCRIYNAQFWGTQTGGDSVIRLESLGGGTHTASAMLAGSVMHNNLGSPVAAVLATDDAAPGSQTTLFVINCTIANHDTGYGILGINNPQLRLANSIIWDNAAGDVSNGPAQTDASYSIFREAAAYAGPANFAADPRFLRPDRPDELRGISPAIDSGRNSELPPDLMDVDGDGDFVEPLPLDIHHHARRSDDPLTTDTGSGTGDIVDRGAYEFPRTCVGDFNYPFGEQNFFDISSFLAAFAAASPTADIAAPFGSFDFFDVSAFLNAYSTGCP